MTKKEHYAYGESTATKKFGSTMKELKVTFQKSEKTLNQKAKAHPFPALRCSLPQTSSAACRNHALLLTKEKKLYAVGGNFRGQLGVGKRTCEKFTEPQLVLLQNVTHVSCSDLISAAVTIDGELYTWSVNENGQLGHGYFSSERFSFRK
jgi:alpha-tubulin suppressor-like RCC1 family protein